MARQIDKKWIADGAIDGSKIQLLEGQSIVIQVDGQPINLLTLNENGNASLPQGEVPNIGYVDESIAELQELLEQDIANRIATIEGELDQEILDREAGDEATLQAAKDYTDAQISAIDLSPYETIVNVDSKDEATLQAAKDYTDAEIAAIDLSPYETIVNVDAKDLVLQDQIDTLKVFGYEQVVHVAKNGLDTNSGKQHSPFLTITAALNSITDAAPTKRYAIKVAPGAYTEASLALKANVFIIGEGQKESVRITGAVSLDNSFSGSGDHRSGFSSVTLLSAADFNWATVTSGAGKLYFNEVLFASTVNMYGHNNAIAQAQFNACIIFGALTISGINVGVFSNNVCYGNINLNQHPNGGMATVLVANGGYCNVLTQTASVNDFNRRSASFLRHFNCEKLVLDGPSVYADVDLISQGKQTPDILNGANLIALNPRINHDLTTQMIVPKNTNAHNMGDWGKQWFWNFGYVHASSGTDLFLISYPESFAPDSSGKSIGIYTDGAGLQENVDGGSIEIATSTTSGTGVRGAIKLDAREIDVSSKQVKNLADGTDASDAVNKGQLDSVSFGLQDQIDTEKERIDAILELSDADKDSFKEIVDLINSIDTENDEAFAGYVLSNDERVGDLEDRLDAVEADKEVIEVESIGEAPALGLVGKVYVAKDTNKLYRWATSNGGELTFDLVVGAGETYETLESAIAAASNGQNILVKPGTYLVSSTIAVNKEVKIVGENADTVIFETAASTSAPVSMFNVSANNVALAKLTIKHRKTSNTSVETAVVASGGGFPQTRITNFILEQCKIEFLEFGMTVRAENWCVRDSQFTYATGAVSNSCRAIGIYGTKGNAFIKDNFLKNDVLNGTAFRPFYLTATTGTNPNETVEGKLVLEGTTHVGPLAQFWNHDNQQGSPGAFELQIKNNITNESNLFAGFAAGIANSGDMFSSITLSGNTLSNLHAIDGGKGIFGVYGTANFRTSALVVHASNNTLGQEVYRTGWVAVDGSTVGKETGTPAFTVALDSVIPASGEVPSIIPSGSSSYVELSPDPDLSGIEANINSLEANTIALDLRLDAIEAKGFARNYATVGEELAFLDLDREYSILFSVSVDRVMVHEGVDFTTSVVAGKTRITWINSLAQPDGEEAIETGDQVFWSGAY